MPIYLTGITFSHSLIRCVLVYFYVFAYVYVYVGVGGTITVWKMMDPPTLRTLHASMVMRWLRRSYNHHHHHPTSDKGKREASPKRRRRN